MDSAAGGFLVTVKPRERLGAQLSSLSKLSVPCNNLKPGLNGTRPREIAPHVSVHLSDPARCRPHSSMCLRRGSGEQVNESLGERAGRLQLTRFSFFFVRSIQTTAGPGPGPHFSNALKTPGCRASRWSDPLLCRRHSGMCTSTCLFPRLTAQPRTEVSPPAQNSKSPGPRVGEKSSCSQPSGVFARQRLAPHHWHEGCCMHKRRFQMM